MERSEMIMMASQSNQMDYHRTYRYTIFICPVSIPQVPASNNVTLKNLIIKEIITSYMSNMRNQPDFTHSLILVHGTKNSPIVTIRVGKDETVLGPMKGVVSNWFHVEVPRSNLLHSSQINPQLYLLGNILIRFNDIFDAHCNRNPYSDSSDLKSEIRDLCQQLDSGHPPSEGWTGIYPREFIFSCLSHQFAKKAFLSGKNVE
ncbi:hypothetical protein DFH28DRAFT_685702 [Melampsora americana]|nr:hypothetical protein DFH28DRAFT_685702 [Melampsora americana]